MALAEANVRVTLEVARFERELQAKVRSAAQRAGRDFDREMQRSMASTGRTAAAQFRTAAREGMVRAGRDAAQGFDVSFRNGLSQTGGRVAQRLSQGLRVQVSRAGLDAGRGFADNVTTVLRAAGVNTGRTFVNAMSTGIFAGATRAGNGAGQALSRGAVTGAASAGRAAGRQFNISFGVGTTAAGRPLLATFAVLGAEIATTVGPGLKILAGFPPLLFATVTAAGVAIAAFRGIGDAFKAINSGDIKKLQEAMRELSPAAQSVVREFSAMRPALSGLRREIQDAFFAQLSGQLTDLSRAFTGPLRAGIVDTANSLGALSRSFIEVFTSAQGVRNLDRVFRGTSDFIDQLRPGIRNLTDGFLAFSAQAAPGLNSMAQALSNLLTRFGQFLTRSAQSGRALVWVEEGVQGLKELGRTIADLGRIFATIAGAARPLAVALAGIFDLAASLASAFAQLPGPIQTAVLAAVLLSRSGLPTFLRDATSAATGQVTVFQRMAESFRNTSGAVNDYIQRQTGFLAVSAAVNGASQRTLNALDASGTAFGRFAGAASGAASALTVGFGSAVRGLVGALGGPWGVALAAAGVALSIFSTNSAQAAQRAAEYNARVREIQGTLNRTTGAITQASVEMAASDDRVRRAVETFRAYGVASNDVVQGALKQGTAHDRVEASLRRQATSYLDAIRANGDLQAVQNATGLSADQLATALLGSGKEADRLNTIYNSLLANGDATSAGIAGLIGRLREQSTGLRDARTGWLEYFTQAQKATEQQRLIAASIPPATREAQRLADAMGILSDNTSDASQKAVAFSEVMNVLAGGTINVQAAQASWNATLQRIAEQTQTNIDRQKGYGAALLTTNGQINTANVNGNTLFQTYQTLSQGLSTSSAALIDNALKTGDVAGAMRQVSANVQAARDSFVAQAMQMGLNETQANRLADTYGLIPKDVTTKAALAGYENVRAQLVDVQAKVKDIPPDKFVNVGALTKEAQDRLKEIGFTVNNLPNGDVEVRANTEPAKQSLGSLLASWGNRVLNWVVNVAGGKAAGDIVENAKGNILGYANGGNYNRLRPMSANRAQIVGPDTWRVIGDRAIHDEAYIPINNSARSRALLNETARRMGFQLFADGGLLGTVKGVGSSLTISPGAIVVNAPYSSPELVARATVNEIARAAAS